MPDAVKVSSPATGEFWEIPVLFEDGQLLVLNKPAQLLVSPDRADPKRPNLMELLHRGIERDIPWAKQRGLGYLMNAHRLDSGTGGVLVLADIANIGEYRTYLSSKGLTHLQFDNGGAEAAIMSAETSTLVRDLLQDALPSLLTLDDVAAWQREARAVFLDDRVRDYIVNLVRATRGARYVDHGASPRAALALATLARARAYLEDRRFVTPDDVKEILSSVVSHRLMLAPQAMLEGVTTQTVVQRLLAQVPVPR